MNSPVLKRFRCSLTTNITDKGISIRLDSSSQINNSNVYYAVWSSQDGQDDLKWYRANSSGNALAAFTNHSSYGTYNVHAYYNQDGRLLGLDAATLEIARPSISTTITKQSNTSYTVTVKDVPAYMSSVLLPT